MDKPGIIERLQDRRERLRSRRITREGARERAGQGAAYLDDVDPAWFWRVEADALELGSGCACVLGQLYGSFMKGLSRAHLVDAGSAPRLGRSPVDLGLLCTRGVCEALQEQDYEYLNQAWREEIRSRQEREAREVARRIRSIELYYDPEEEQQLLLS